MCTGQWADLPLESLAEKVGACGFDRLELTCWGDHFDVVAPWTTRRTAAAGGSCSSGTACDPGRSASTCSATSIEWEDSGMDREYGAQDALRFVRGTDFAPSSVAFDAAMQR